MSRFNLFCMRRAPRQLAIVALVLCIASAGWCQEITELRYLDSIAPPSEPLPPPSTELKPIDDGLTLSQLEGMALGSNPSVRRLAALVGAARGNWVQVGLGPNPSIGYEGQQLGSGGLAEQHGILFTQEFVRGGKLRLNSDVAMREQMRVEQELAAQELRVLTDVRIAFYQVLLAQRQIELTDNLIRISAEGSEVVDALFRAQDVGRGDVLQAQLELENARILAENARNRRESAWRSLAAVVGDPCLQCQRLVGDALAPPKQLDYCQTLVYLQESSPEIMAANVEVERARVAIERARVEPISNVSFQGLFNWQDNGIGGKPDGGVAVTLPMPLFNRNQGGIVRAEHELIAASQALSQLQLDLQNRLAPVFEQYSNARNQVERYEKTLLPAAQESLDLMRKVYAAGETDYTTLLTTQRTFAHTHLNYLDAVRALRIAEVEIEGMLLRGSLQNGSGGGAFDRPMDEPFQRDLFLK